MSFVFLGKKPPSDRFCDLHKNTYCLDKKCFVSNEAHFRGALLEAAEVLQQFDRGTGKFNNEEFQVFYEKNTRTKTSLEWVERMLRVSAGETE